MGRHSVFYSILWFVYHQTLRTTDVEDVVLWRLLAVSSSTLLKGHIILRAIKNTLFSSSSSRHHCFIKFRPLDHSTRISVCFFTNKKGLKIILFHFKRKHVFDQIFSTIENDKNPFHLTFNAICFKGDPSVRFGRRYE